MTEDYILKKSKIIQNIHNIMNNDNNDIQSYLLSIIDTLSDKELDMFIYTLDMYDIADLSVTDISNLQISELYAILRKYNYIPIGDKEKLQNIIIQHILPQANKDRAYTIINEFKQNNIVIKMLIGISDLSELSIKELQIILSKCILKTSGTKEELYDRLLPIWNRACEEYKIINTIDILHLQDFEKEWCEQFKDKENIEPINDKESEKDIEPIKELIDLSEEELLQLDMKELQSILKKYELFPYGDKETIYRRVLYEILPNIHKQRAEIIVKNLDNNIIKELSNNQYRLVHGELQKLLLKCNLNIYGTYDELEYRLIPIWNEVNKEIGIKELSMVDDLSTLTKNELLELLRKVSLAHNGNKQELQDRLWLLWVKSRSNEGKIAYYLNLDEITDKVKELEDIYDLSKLTILKCKELLDKVGLPKMGNIGILHDRLWPIWMHARNKKAESEKIKEEQEKKERNKKIIKELQSIDDLSQLTNDELQRMLQDCHLIKSGNKQILIDRLYIIWKQIREERFEKYKPVIDTWSCPVDGMLHPWKYKGKNYLRNSDNEIWIRRKDGEVGEWIGVYLPKKDHIDASIPEPEFEDEESKENKCNKEHKLILKDWGSKLTYWRACHKCREVVKTSWNCNNCDYEICNNCNISKNKPTDIINRPKKEIPKDVKTQVWDEYVGNKVSTKCLCCKKRDIHIRHFHCGHVIAKSEGGDFTVKNLRPICAQCNLSMGTMSMNEYTKTYFGYY